jgi:hypothetical protein
MKLIEQPLQQINDNDNNNPTNDNKSSSSSSINDNNRRNSNFNNSINSSSNRNNNNEELKSMKIFNFRKFLPVVYFKNVYRFTGNMIINKIRNWKEIVKKSCKRFIYLIDVKKIGNSGDGSSSNYFYHTTDELDMIINEYEMKMSIDLLNNDDDDDNDDDNDNESNENDVDVINIHNNKTNYNNGTDNEATNNNDHTNNIMKKDKSLTKEYNRLIPRINRLVSWRDHCLVTKIESEPTIIQIMKTVEVPAILLHPISMKGRRRSVMDVFDDDNEEDKCK